MVRSRGSPESVRCKWSGLSTQDASRRFRQGKTRHSPSAFLLLQQIAARDARSISQICEILLRIGAEQYGGRDRYYCSSSLIDEGLRTRGRALRPWLSHLRRRLERIERQFCQNFCMSGRFAPG
jgi:hypothetical protein